MRQENTVGALMTGTDFHSALDRILATPRFTRAARRSRFLRFVAEETLFGRGDELKEYVVGREVFGKAESYDPREDSTVRTEASKLRSSLREYYAAEGSEDLVIISLPLGAYKIVFEVRGPAHSGSPAMIPASVVAGRNDRWLSSLAAVLLLFCGTVAWKTYSRATYPATLRPLTSYPGSELRPQISPDETLVVFAWNGPNQDNFDIYTRPLAGGEPKRLTTDPARDVYATWSPDGKWIAFARNPGAHGSVWLVPAGGGSERKLTDGEAFSLCFSPDGKTLAVVDKEGTRAPWRLISVNIETGERRTLTSPPAGILGDAYPAWSPDGKWLAFVRLTNAPASEIMIQSAAGGEPAQLTHDNKNIFGITWFSGGRQIVFSSDRGGIRSLWKLPVSIPMIPGGNPHTAAAPSRVEGAGEDAMHPSGRGTMIAYQRTSEQFNIWLKDLESDETALRVAASTRWDVTPALSPDASRVAFASDRTGNMEIWLAGRDSSGTRQLTFDPQAYSRMPQWSPDGRWIAYESRGLGSPPAIALTSPDGGKARILSASPAGDRRPMWSADGNWIFFRSSRSGIDGVYRIAMQNGKTAGQPQPVAPGAVEAGESGGSEYLCRSDTGLLRDKVLIAAFNCDNQWAAGGTRVVWLRNGKLHILDGPGAHERTLQPLSNFAPSDTAPLGLSANGRWLVWSNEDIRSTDAMLLENGHR
jgi:Tol biopolymer transport system component